MHKLSDNGFSANYLDVNQFPFANSRKRALSFAASSNDSPMFSLSGLPLVNSSTQLAQQPLTVLTTTTPSQFGVNNAINNNALNGNSVNTNTTSNVNEKQRTATKICRVCGDKAYSYNFNVITCESCKAFFRRNANKEKVLIYFLFYFNECT